MSSIFRISMLYIICRLTSLIRLIYCPYIYQQNPCIFTVYQKHGKFHDILLHYHYRFIEIHGRHSRKLLPHIKVLHMLIDSSVIRHDWFNVLYGYSNICICVSVHEFIAKPNQRHNFRFFL